MSIVDYAVQTLHPQHVLVFVRTDDKEVHAFELGEPEHVPTAEEEAARRGVRGGLSQHSAMKQHNKARRGSDEDGAAYSGQQRRASKDLGQRRGSNDSQEGCANKKHAGGGSGGKYPVHFWSPVTLRHPAPKIPTKFQKIGANGITADQLNHKLKRTFHHRTGCEHFLDAKRFASHLVDEAVHGSS